MSDEKPQEEVRGARGHALHRKLTGGRGGGYAPTRACLNRIFDKLTTQEANVLDEVIRYHLEDAERDGRRAAARQPWRR